MLEYIKLAIKVIVDRSARKRFIGLRPVAICVVKSVDTPSRYLLIRPVAHHVDWLPPQEGMEVGETVEDAALRCMRIELGLGEDKIQFRKSVYVGDRILADRIGDRDLKYSICRMRGKSYFAALVIADTKEEIIHNPAEVHAHQWYEADELGFVMKDLVPSKADVVAKAFQQMLGIRIEFDKPLPDGPSDASST